MAAARDEDGAVFERVCTACGVTAPVALLACGATGEERALCADCLGRPGRLRALIATMRADPAPDPRASAAATGCRDGALRPYRTERGWEHAACILDDVPAQLDALARQGWECTFVSTPHQGSLTLLGYFRRRVTRLPERDRCRVPHLGR